MQLDGSLSPTKMSPVKHPETQINNGRIHTDQFVLKPKLFLSDNLHPTSVKEVQKDMLIEFPGTVLVSIGQGRMTGSGNPKVLEFAFTASQPPADLSEGMGATQLTEQHGHKLAPRGKSFSMAFGFGLFNHLLKL
jgi:hypothetical protein